MPHIVSFFFFCSDLLLYLRIFIFGLSFTPDEDMLKIGSFNWRKKWEKCRGGCEVLDRSDRVSDRIGYSIG